MEGFGVAAASVVAVAQLAGACLRLTRKWIGPSDHDSAELTHIRTSLYAFNGALKNFQTCLEFNKTSVEPLVLTISRQQASTISNQCCTM